MEDYAEAQRAHSGEVAQMGRRHILLVNRDPALLALVRVLLQEERYNVTTTNAVPRTFALIAAARPALIVVDLAVAERSGWDLLIRLHAGAATAAIPVIVTARDRRLLAHAREHPDLFGAGVHLAVPFTVESLLGTVLELIGEAGR